MKDEFPKLSELKDLLKPEKVEQSIFNDFENSIKTIPEKSKAFTSLEGELQKINDEGWQFFKTEVAPRLFYLKNGRGFEPFLNIVNQVRAFNYLSNGLGCYNVAFVQTDKKETPDLEAELDGVKVLCEVKTINASDDETKKRIIIKNGGIVSGFTQNKLPDQFFGKLKSSLDKARSQLHEYSKGESTRNIIFLVINFDDVFSEYKDEYYSQIDEYLQGNPVGDFELLIFNQKTAFPKNIVMRSAIVINE